MARFTETGVELVAKGAGDFFGTLDKAGGKIAGFGKTVGKVAVAGMAAFGAAAAGVAVASVNAAVEFESAWAGVIKTTDGLVDEMGNLTAAGKEVQQGFRNLAKEIPTSVEELLAIGELGGQLGIARESLVDFTRTIAAMGEATNLTTEEAATGFAQIANIMQTPQDQIENMGSSVVALGNNFATTERDILNFAQRIAGAGAIAGLTEAEVFAIGAAFSSVGVQAEAGGTAVQKVLLGMNQAVLEGGEQLDIFAATAGLTSEDFATFWEMDAGQAFRGFVSGLGLAGDDALGILSALGLEDQRLTRAFLSLAGAGDLLNDTMNESITAFRDNTALTTEAEQRYKTTASQFKIFKNVIKDVAITIGSALLPFVNDLLQAAKPLISELGQKLPAFLQGKLIPTIKRVIGVVGDIIKIFSKVISGEGLQMTGIFERFGEKGKPFVMFILNAARFARNDLIPAIQAIIQWMGQALPIAVQFLADLWTNVLWPAISAFGEFVISTLIPLLGQLFTWLSQNIPVALQFLAELWTGTLQPALQAVWEFIQTSVIPALQQIFNWFSQNIPVAIQILSGIFNSVLKPAIQAILTVFQGVIAWVQENWPTFQAIIEGVINTIREIVIPIVTEIATFIIDQFTTMVAWVQENWPLIQEVISDVIGTIQTIIQTVLTAIQNFWMEHGAAIMDFVRTVWNLIKGIIETASEAVRNIIQAVLLVIAGRWEEAWNLIKQTAQNIWEKLQEFFKAAGPKLWEIIRGIVKQIPNIILSIGGKLLEVGGKIVEKLKEGIGRAWDNLVSWFKDRLSSLTNMLPFSEPRDPTSPLQGLALAGEAIVNNIAQGLTKAGRVLPSTLNSIFSGIVSGMRHFLEFDELLDIAEFVPGVDMSEWMGLPENARAVADKLRNSFANIIGAFPSVDFTETLSGFDEALRHFARYGETLHLDEFITGFRELPSELRSNLTSLYGRFADFYEGTFGNLGELLPGIQNLLSASVPAAAAPGVGTGTNIAVTNQFNTSIHGGMSQAAFETQVQRVIERSMEQAT